MDRKSPAEGWHDDPVEIGVAGPGTVQPKGLAVDPGTDEDMIEQGRHRQARVETVTAGTAHHRGLGLDLQRVQEGEQQGRLAFAVAETARPGVGGIGGHQIAVVHALEDVPYPILHKSKRRLGAAFRIGLGCLDLRDFGRQRRAGRDYRSLIVERRHRRREIRPAPKAGELQPPYRHEARRCVFRPHQRR